MISRWPHPLFFAAAAELVLGLLLLLLLDHDGWAKTLAQASGYLTVCACVAQLITNQQERNPHGGHRKAVEAHRAGAGRNAGRGTRARRGARRGTGAGVNPSEYARIMQEIHAIEIKQRALRGLPALPAASTPPAPKPRPVGEFDGQRAEFAAGVVTGTRAFAVDRLGRLTGVTYQTVWTPGENEAKCLEQDAFASAYAYATGASRAVGPTQSGRAPHSLAECAHGFYGYYEGSNDYYTPGRVMAVVEAYGETVIGTRGFRASKARIVALHLPDELPKSTRALVTRNYAGVPLFDSFEAMVAEFPPDDAGHGINPSTDPDFWTREA